MSRVWCTRMQITLLIFAFLISVPKSLAVKKSSESSAKDSSTSTSNSVKENAKDAKTLPGPAILAIEIVDPNEEDGAVVKREEKTKRTIESSLGYGGFGEAPKSPKFMYYKYSQHDIPTYSHSKRSQKVNKGAPSSQEVDSNVPLDIQKSIEYNLGTQVSVIPSKSSGYPSPSSESSGGVSSGNPSGTTLFTTVNSQGQLGTLSPHLTYQNLGSKGPVVPVIILRIYTNQLESPNEAVYPKLPDSDPYAGLNNVNIMEIVQKYLQQIYQHPQGVNEASVNLHRAKSAPSSSAAYLPPEQPQPNTYPYQPQPPTQQQQYLPSPYDANQFQQLQHQYQNPMFYSDPLLQQMMSTPQLIQPNYGQAYSQFPYQPESAFPQFQFSQPDYNGKYYQPQQQYNTNALPYTSNAQSYVTNAQPYTTNAQPYTTNAQPYTTNAQSYTGNGQQYTGNVQPYTGNGQQYTESGQYSTNGQQYTTNGHQYYLPPQSSHKYSSASLPTEENYPSKDHTRVIFHSNNGHDSEKGASVGSSADTSPATFPSAVASSSIANSKTKHSPKTPTAIVDYDYDSTKSAEQPTNEALQEYQSYSYNPNTHHQPTSDYSHHAREPNSYKAEEYKSFVSKAYPTPEYAVANYQTARLRNYQSTHSADYQPSASYQNKKYQPSATYRSKSYQRPTYSAQIYPKSSSNSDEFQPIVYPSNSQNSISYAPSSSPSSKIVSFRTHNGAEYRYDPKYYQQALEQYQNQYSSQVVNPEVSKHSAVETDTKETPYNYHAKPEATSRSKDDTNGISNTTYYSSPGTSTKSEHTVSKE